MRCQLFLAIITAVLLFSCSDNVEKRKKGDLSLGELSLNILDAQSVAVIENPIGGRISETTDNLFKLTTNGSLEKIKFVNADGTDIDPNLVRTIIEVDRVYDLNSSFILLIGNFTIFSEYYEQLHQYSGLLVRKEDGAFFDFDRYKFDLNIYHQIRKGEMLFKYDASGNIYFPTSQSTGVSKLIVDNPDVMGVTDYLPTGQKAYHFDLASDGSCIYRYQSNAYKFRIKKPTGGVFEVQIDGRFNVDFWTGTNGLLYFTSESRGFGNGSSMIHSINVQGEEVVIDTLWSDVNTGIVSFTDWPHRIRRDNSMVFIHSTSGFEFFEETNTLVKISLPIAQSDRIIVNSKNFYYIASGTDLYKVRFDTHEYVRLLKTGEYEIYSLNVDDNDTVLFSGLRFKDGKMIFAEIDSEGNLTVIDEELDRKATMLQRLN